MATVIYIIDGIVKVVL